jgi:hypothetical protein
MKNYSIVRIGNAYVIQADEKGILKVASRRRAARLVTEAAELMVSQPVMRICEQPSPSGESQAIPGDQS